MESLIMDKETERQKKRNRRGKKRERRRVTQTVS